MSARLLAPEIVLELGFMNLILMTLLISINNYAMARTIECSDSEGAIRFSQWTYPGGARPYPGMEVGRDSWMYQEQLIGREIRRESRPAELSGLVVEWEDDSRVELEVRQSPHEPMVKISYVQRVSLTREDGKPLLEKKPELTIWRQFLFCTHEYSRIPLP